MKHFLKQLGVICLWVGLSLSAFAQQTDGSEKEQDSATPSEETAPPLSTLTLASGFYDGLYYLNGMLVAALADDAPGGLACDKGGSCGVSGTVIVNITSEGSVTNVDKLVNGEVDLALIQSNIVYMAHQKLGIFDKTQGVENLRAVANLYPEVLQIVVHEDSEIQSLEDLKGKRISVGAEHSGMFYVARDVLAAAGVSMEEATLIHDDTRTAAQAFKDEKIDALMIVSGVPHSVLTDLEKQMDLRFLPIQSSTLSRLLDKNTYYRKAEIPAQSYHSVPEDDISSLSVHALLVSTKNVDNEAIYQLTKALWNSEQRPFWFERIAVPGSFDLKHSLDGIGIPLHSGAKRYYDQIGKRF